jgi:hypothetical protein
MHLNKLQQSLLQARETTLLQARVVKNSATFATCATKTDIDDLYNVSKI